MSTLPKLATSKSVQSGNTLFTSWLSRGPQRVEVLVGVVHRLGELIFQCPRTLALQSRKSRPPKSEPLLACPTAGGRQARCRA